MITVVLKNDTHILQYEAYNQDGFRWSLDLVEIETGLFQSLLFHNKELMFENINVFEKTYNNDMNKIISAFTRWNIPKIKTNKSRKV